MCGIAGVFGKQTNRREVEAMLSVQRHRGPDGEGIYVDPENLAALGHNRLSIIDLSSNGSQPMRGGGGRYIATLNGEIYNYLELRKELEGGFRFRSKSDTEVLLAAYARWGAGCLDRLIGMFAFVIWDEKEKSAFVARDRFGVKPLYYHKRGDGAFLYASEIRTLQAAGGPRKPNEKAWATYLSDGLYDHSTETFWKDIYSLPGGHSLLWKDGTTQIRRWYDLVDRVGDDLDGRSEDEVRSEYFDLMKDSVTLRFRSDVPVGINLSGGLDSSTLLGLVHEVQGAQSDVKAFTFATGDPRYDELPWVESMLARTNHELVVCTLGSDDVPALAEDVHRHQDEPFGGIPTLAYAKVFDEARKRGVIVLLDGNGMDEQWAGYDYYNAATNGNPTPMIQGTTSSPVRPDCLAPEFRALGEPFVSPRPFKDGVRNLQYRDARFTKIPRAMRFNDRISMRSSTELREPFLDHRLFELAMRQPIDRKISDGIQKKMLRDIVRDLLPIRVSEAPKRPLQTPQREWLRNELTEWAGEQICQALSGPFAAWLDKRSVLDSWVDYCRGNSDNSFYIWQWITLGLTSTSMRAAD
ncbi:MAG: asparagine synthase (glutamine-hydrolyzing) [Acidobacteriota bacterium]